ncbi:MAG TPA: Na+/H+ antiporter NhaA [Propionicimonas sp.]|nr:Na+/H+ antiporter NhaA [Propionicimonas sp.]HQD95931.1 Na+/H+ antiporter NhaA [Propionicimonas sp.]
MTQTPVTLARGAYAELQRINRILRRESVGGILLLVAALAAMLCANFAPGFYFGLRDLHLGGDLLGLHLDLSIGHWAADGLLAVFFFLVGLELKREFVTGDLRDPKTALVPVVAAVGGVAVPALIYSAFTFAYPDMLAGWAIPAATDIAFALAVLAVIGSHLPAALRTFLLTLAVADDLIAITIIAFFYTRDLKLEYFLAGLVPIVAFALLAHLAQRFLVRHGWAAFLLLLPIGLVAWALAYNSGVHATVAGVLLALGVPVRPAKGDTAEHGLAEVLEHKVRPFSAGVAVPVFAFFSAGVLVGGLDGFVAAVTSPIGLGVIVGLVVGKAIGISGATWLVTRLRHAQLDPDLAWIDVFGLAVLGGIGFTVSLLVSELSFGQGTPHDDIGKVAILTASVLAATLAAVLLGSRNRHYRAVEVAEQVDADADGVPDRFQH